MPSEGSARQGRAIQPERPFMTSFRCVPMPTETADRFRKTGRDDRGNALIEREVTEPGGSPCRHCLETAQPGDTMLLGSYDLPQPRGIYWTPSPIFVHRKPCKRFASEDAIAPTLRNSLISVRAYDYEDLCLYDLGYVCPGDAIEAPLARALCNPRTAFVNIHTARPGCWLARVERVV